MQDYNPIAPLPPPVPGGIFPIEIVEQILCRASVETVGLCTAVCKPWCNLIKSTHFVFKYLSRKLDSDSEECCLFLFRTGRRRKWYYTFDLGKEDWRMKKLDEDLPFLAKHRLSYIGSCGGLVGFSDATDNQFVFWNPCFRNKSLVHPYKNDRYTGHSRGYESRASFYMGMGLDISRNIYKVLIVTEYRRVPYVYGDRCEFELFSVRSESFESLDELVPPGFNDFGVTQFVPTSPHTINIIAGQSGTNYSILSFDFSTTKFSAIPLPSNLRVSEVKSMMTYRASSLALVCGTYRSVIYEVWVMQEYPRADSWLRLFRIRDTTYKILGLTFNDSCLIERHSSVENPNQNDGDDVEVKFEDPGMGIFSVHRETHVWKELAWWTFSGTSHVASFVKSLALLDPPHAVDDSE